MWPSLLGAASWERSLREECKGYERLWCPQGRAPVGPASVGGQAGKEKLPQGDAVLGVIPSHDKKMSCMVLER